MKRMNLAISLAIGLAASPAVAQHAEHEQGATNTEVGQPAKASGMAMGSAAMQGHRQKMQEMTTLMEQARATKDPVERARLMAEHREKMNKQMGAMMQGDSAAMMKACHERMTMMHDMMAQMSAQQAMSPTK